MLEKGLSFFYQEKIFFNVNVLSREGEEWEKNVSQKMFFSQQTYFLTREGGVLLDQNIFTTRKNIFFTGGGDTNFF